jgi:hypothetical protein
MAGRQSKEFSKYYAYHQIRIRNVMLNHPTTQNNHSRLPRKNSFVVDRSNVRRNVNDQAWITEGVEIYHVTQGTVGDGWAVDGNVVLQISGSHLE